MNERIKEIYNESLEQHVSNNSAWEELNPEKFAELIVKECAQFVEDKFDFCGDEIIIAEEVRKHLGVEA